LESKISVGEKKQRTKENAVSKVTQAEQTAVDKLIARQAAKAFPEVTQAQRTAMGKCLTRQAAKPCVRFNERRIGTTQQIKIEHADHHDHQTIGETLLMDALGTADPDFAKGIKRQLYDASRLCSRDVDVGTLNFMLSVIKDIGPRDQLEAMLATQMAAVHVAAMKLARRPASEEDVPLQDSAERAFNKLCQTFVMLMDALKRYRAGAEQKVTLQHVSVAEGGQAIVGNVTQVRREQAGEKTAAPPRPALNTNIVPMPTPQDGPANER